MSERYSFTSRMFAGRRGETRNWAASLQCGLVLLLLCATTGCRQDMHDQPKYEALEASTFFPDGRASRPLVPGTVARGQLREDTHLYEGKIAGKPAETFPFPIDLKTLERGQQRYNIYCSPCHDGVGNGNGMVVRRGFRASSVVSYRTSAAGTSGLSLRRHHERIWRDAGLCGANSCA